MGKLSLFQTLPNRFGIQYDEVGPGARLELALKEFPEIAIEAQFAIGSSSSTKEAGEHDATNEQARARNGALASLEAARSLGRPDHEVE